MEKIVVIEECWECIHHRMGGTPDSFCAKKERDIPDANNIPSWCPLQDAPKK